MNFEKKRIVCIVQARMGSSRLPGKIALQLFDKTVLEHVIARLKLSKSLDEIVVATTDNRLDDQIVNLCVKADIKFFRGSEDDVLSRYFETAKAFKADFVVRVTSDCPLIDPQIIDSVVELLKKSDASMVCNVGLEASRRTFPRGLDTEIFAFDLLKDAHEKANQKYQREHVTPYLYEHVKNIVYYKNDQNLSDHRWTLDVEEDWKLINAIYKHLYKDTHNFFLKEIVELFQKYPELKKINQGVSQKFFK